MRHQIASKEIDCKAPLTVLHCSILPLDNANHHQRLYEKQPTLAASNEHEIERKRELLLVVNDGNAHCFPNVDFLGAVSLWKQTREL